MSNLNILKMEYFVLAIQCQNALNFLAPPAGRQRSFSSAKEVKFCYFATFCQFSQKRSDNFFIFDIQLLGDDIDQLSRDRFD